MGAEVAIAAALLGTALSARESSRARGEAKKEAKKSKREQDALVGRMETERRVEDTTAQRDEQRRRQRALAAGQSGRQGTILTSPLGVAGGGAGAAPQRQTLLGY